VSLCPEVQASIRFRRPTAAKLEKAQHSVRSVPLAMCIRSTRIIGRSNLVRDGLPLVAAPSLQPIRLPRLKVRLSSPVVFS
jgi:hypothetical protein